MDDIHKFMLSIVPHIQVHAERIDISVNPNNLPRWFDGSGGHVKRSATTMSDNDRHFVSLTIPIRLKRVGNEMKLIVEDGSHPKTLILAWYVFSSVPM